MAFALQPGEKTLSEHGIGLVDGRKSLPATLVLTDRRLVVIVGAAPQGWAFLFGLIGAAIAGLLAATDLERVRYQIKRERFASVEQGERKLIIIRDDGEGYGHTSFAITSKDSFADWQQRMHRWAAGLDGGAPLPPARVLD